MPYQKCKNPGGDCYWLEGKSKVYMDPTGIYGHDLTWVFDDPQVTYIRRLFRSQFTNPLRIQVSPRKGISPFSPIPHTIHVYGIFTYMNGLCLW